MSHHEPALQTHNLTIGYRASRKPDVVIAQNLNLRIKKGELVGLLGPNGAGKSTLLRTLAGMQKPLAGQVCLSGEDVNHIANNDLAKRLSVVLTDRPNIGLLNGYALVALGRHPYTDWTGRLSPYDEAIIRWAIEAVRATDIADQPVMELSDGQRQKLMIARALAQETDAILLDEPTAYLDLPHRVETMQLLKHLAHETDRAILLSTHDLDLALRSADTLWLMTEGQIRAGTPEDLILSDAFEETFHSDGVIFDKRTGAFSVSDAPRIEIYVQGNGIPFIWTCRALERNQFTIKSEPTATRVEIHQRDGQIIWDLVDHEHQSRHHSIQHLLEAIKEINHHEQFTTVG